VRERDLDGRVRERRAQRIGPLDERDRALGDFEREPQLLVVDRPEPVRVEVSHRHGARVALRDRERRARDVLGDAERPRGAADESGLPRPELAAERHDVPGHQQGRDGRADRLGAARRRRLELDQNSPSCSGCPAGSAAAAARGSGTSCSTSASGPGGARAGSDMPISPGIRAKSASSVASIDGV